ncbi:MAG: glycosyltransferase family 39 protein [Candidatus Nanohaloarchaea archaeon]|nr:glycosyltransferase family 39 protein [Candidatus Nanohaloarchaea archaeon]
MNLGGGVSLTKQHALWGALIAGVYVLLYVFLPSTPVGTMSQLHGDIRLLLGMRGFNVLLFALTAVLTYVLADDVFGDERVGLLAALLVVISPLANHAIVAWTHVPVAFLTVVAFIAYRRFLDGYETRWFILVAAAASFIFTIKYPDVVLMFPILGHMALLVVRDREYQIVRKSIIPLVVLFLVIAPTAAFHYSSFGSVATTPYHMRPQALPPNNKPNIAVTFDPARLVDTVPAMLFRFDPDMELLQQNVQDFEFAEYKSALFQSSPPLTLGLFGFILAWRRKDNQRFVALAASSSALLILLYGSWIYFSAGWTTNIRYLTSIIPLLAVFTAYAVTRLDIDWRRLQLYGSATAVAAFSGTAYYSVQAQDLVAKAGLNTLAFVTALVLSILFLLNESYDRNDLRILFHCTFGAAIGVGGALVLVLGNLRLFNAPPGSLLITNIEQTLFLGLALAAAITGTVYILFDEVRRRSAVSEWIDNR